jgi:hypothetical protein
MIPEIMVNNPLARSSLFQNRLQTPTAPSQIAVSG